MSTLVVALSGLMSVLAQAAAGGRADEASGAKTPTPAEIAEAGDRFQRATEMFEENNLPGALAEFRRAQAIAPSYKLLYNIGQVCYLLHDYPCALESFSRYLVQGGSAVPPRRRNDVQRDIERLRGRVARLRIVTDPTGAEVAVDDVVMGRTPLAEPVLVGAGRPRVTVTLPGYSPVNMVVEVAAMETATVEVKLQSLATAPAPAPPPPASGGPDLSARMPAPSAPATTALVTVPRAPTPTLPWVVAGTLAAAAGASGGLALWSSSQLKKHRDQWGTQKEDLQQRSARVKQLALLTDLLLGSAVVGTRVATFITVSSSSDGGQQVAFVRRF
jgi:hypothetical protein